MKPEALLRKKQRRERDARRGRLGKGRFDNIVRDFAGAIRLAHAAGEIGSLFGLEGPLRHSIRSDLCLQKWSWSDADDMAREILGMVFLVLRANRPSHDEGQPDWAISTNILTERTLCVRCHAPLPEGHFKYCSDLCGNASRAWAARLKSANEDLAVQMAVRSI